MSVDTAGRDTAVPAMPGWAVWGGTLVATTGSTAGEARPLGPGAHVIGRAADCEIVLPDPDVSRWHLMLRVPAPSASRPGVVMIEDLGSRAGTLVNSKVIEGPTPLRDGDTVTIGRTVLVWNPQPGHAVAPSPAAAAVAAVEPVAEVLSVTVDAVTVVGPVPVVPRMPAAEQAPIAPSMPVIDSVPVVPPVPVVAPIPTAIPVAMPVAMPAAVPASMPVTWVPSTPLPAQEQVAPTAPAQRSWTLPPSKAPARPSARSVMLSSLTSLGGLLTLVGLGMVSDLPLLIPPLAASMALITAGSALPLAQPRNVMGGQVVSALAGFAVLAVVGPGPLAAGIAGGLALTAMLLLRVSHSPAAATAVIVGGTAPAAPRFLTLLVVAVAILLACGVVGARVERKPYPIYWW